MNWRRTCGAAFAVSSVAIISCSEPPPPRPSLHCDELRWPKVVPLCVKVEQELALTHGGHGLLRGSPGYFCTQRTIERVFCSGTPIDVPQVQEALAFASSVHQHEILFDNRLHTCLLGLLHALEG